MLSLVWYDSSLFSPKSLQLKLNTTHSCLSFIQARKNGWHVDGKEGQGDKGYTYDLIIAELSAKGIARKKKDAKTNAFR